MPVWKELTSNMDHVTVKIGEEIAHVGLKMSGCHGFCEMGPLVRIEPYNYLYLKVKLEDCEEIFEKTILHGEPVTRLMYEDNGHVVSDTGRNSILCQADPSGVEKLRSY